MQLKLDGPTDSCCQQTPQASPAAKLQSLMLTCFAHNTQAVLAILVFCAYYLLRIEYSYSVLCNHASSILQSMQLFAGLLATA